MGSGVGFGKSPPPGTVPRRAKLVARARNPLASFRKTDGAWGGYRDRSRQGGHGGRGAAISALRHNRVAAPSPTAEGSTMTMGYVAIVALTTLVLVAVVALAALELFSDRRDK